MYNWMINLFVPDSFDGACASILMHGYAKYNGCGITVRYYRGDCSKELVELKDWLTIADIENAELPQCREIFICAKSNFPRKQIRDLKKDSRNTVVKFGSGYFQKMYRYLVMRSRLSLLYGGYFRYWLHTPKVHYFFETVMETPSIYQLKWDKLGSEEFEQVMSDYLHEVECYDYEQE